MHRKTQKMILIVITLAVICFAGYKICSYFINISNGIEQAKLVAMDKAIDDLGNDCIIVFSKYDYANDCYQIGCTNADDNHAIMYLVTQSVDKKEWFARKLASQGGSDASELFNTPMIIRK